MAGSFEPGLVSQFWRWVFRSPFYCSRSSAWGGSPACWSRNIICFAPAAFPLWNRSCRRLPVRTYPRLELYRDQRARRLCPAGKLSGQSSAGLFSGAVRDMAAHRVPRALRLLHLVPRRWQYRRLSLDWQLDVHRTALDWRHCLCLYHLAYVDDALYRSRSARLPGRIVRQGTGRSISHSVLPVLCCRLDRGLMALRVWHLAVLGEVGHRFRGEGAEAVFGRVPGILLCLDWSGIGQPYFVPLSPATAY